jgi:hypothetical protein
MITITREKLITSVRKRAGMILPDTQRDTSGEKSQELTKKSPQAKPTGGSFSDAPHPKSLPITGIDCYGLKTAYCNIASDFT